MRGYKPFFSVLLGIPNTDKILLRRLTLFWSAVLHISYLCFRFTLSSADYYYFKMESSTWNRRSETVVRSEKKETYLICRDLAIAF